MIDLVIYDIDCDNAPLEVVANEKGPVNTDNWTPEDSTSFLLFVNVSIGAVGLPGSDEFSLTICTKDFLNRSNRWVDPDRTLIVQVFNWTEIKNLISERVHSCERDNWGNTLKILRQKFHWEYDQRTHKK